MSEPGFTDASSQEAYAIFGSTDMLAAMALMAEIGSEARKIGMANISAPLRVMMGQLEADLTALAARTAQTADAAIIARLRETQVRPETTRSLHLQDLIVSLPFPRGSVKIALIEELDKATNPDGYGPYWRAQELGSVAVGNIMTGRILFGSFSGPGHDEMPRGEYAGMRGAPGAEFNWGLPDGEESGLGTISHEDPPRHFLETGTAIAGGDYAHAIKGLSRGYADQIRALSPGAALP